MRIRVIVFTFERVVPMLRLLHDIIREKGNNYDVHVQIYDDASVESYRRVFGLCKENGWEYIKADAHHGKRSFWKWVSTAYGNQKRAPADRFVLLADDMRLCKGFFGKVETLWSAIEDPNKAALNLLVDSGREIVPCWNREAPERIGNVDQVGWVDGCLYCEHSYFEKLNYMINAVQARRWQWDPNLGSGVGQQVTTRLRTQGATLYRVIDSLVHHTGDASKMNPKARKKEPLATVRFVDGVPGEDSTFVNAALASVPERERELKKTVQSLLPQVHKLRVYLNGYANVPRFLEHDRIEVARSQTHGDLGDAGKFFWSSTFDGYHFSCDDDLVYPPNYVSTLVSYLQRFDHQVAVGVHGAMITAPLQDGETSFRRGRKVYRCLSSLDSDKWVHMLGTGALCFHTSTIRVLPNHFKIPNMADVWFAREAQKQRIPLLCIQHKADWLKYLLKDDDKTIWSWMCRSGDDVQTKLIQEMTPWKLWKVEL